MSHQKSELHELLHYLTPQERAELERLATPPTSACICVAYETEGEDAEVTKAAATADYIERNGYAPPMTMHIRFVAPGEV